MKQLIVMDQLWHLVRSGSASSCSVEVLHPGQLDVEGLLP